MKYVTYRDGKDKPKLQVIDYISRLCVVRTPEGFQVSIPSVYLVSWEQHIENLKISKGEK